MKWSDIEEIAVALEDQYGDKDNINLRFTDLRDWIVSLEGFVGSPEACSEKILEAIQAAWISEREDRE
ncbi:feS assembly protein IscX [Neorickettsia helminthoeca str. Oregon]|uniref:FeS assembly protein IscX n=1 Tax=Neorickettsia helminthoeca str. Oregon TaxID=1286528 RepID=X5H4M9_9RICK|nr:Fe-S cluster assembly protein IscX [Neorickettsia helminthoeca]AHX11501.1 feS assembly protein IscX [Neorickettsia helminthoeca str. Oregon]